MGTIFLLLLPVVGLGKVLRDLLLDGPLEGIDIEGRRTVIDTVLQCYLVAAGHD